MTSAGRFAPSPSGELHVGNLRTAMLAWLFARSTGRKFLLRVEDLDRARAGAEEVQLRDLQAVGVTWDGDVVRQTDREPLYSAAIGRLSAAGLAYECFCTRREIQEAPSAPHAPQGAYPGTCRNLTDVERQERRAVRPAAIRLRADVSELTVTDALHGDFTGVVDDFVLRRNDGVAAYNLAVVVDDAEQGIDQVVRGDDLLPSTPRQAYLASLLGYPVPEYAHVPLVLNADGARLAKRDGAVTLADLSREGHSAADVAAWVLASLGLPGTLDSALAAFDPAELPREPWIWQGMPGR
ncbi:tRNA glutamyl-Q(34) synthetase GluQRS [Pseudarthrobacter sp. J75]|uniref:tRNA glutamyl-Q(34) synthetase GluQRS n=1 Tax=unclassified Pseudarthrobacter TaxID=2647000 RepID=UPI002E804DC8|nr:MULTISPECIES: tRNA glutamyl-Q(34) synthetase GluQRS [unclassified Pseudarthrobacter]MEE2523708.1 tRNA glutamyl-Q(34) synthetase GluQRS [Pseudarthrobacter sp. J47]MEE2530099.1 tRNA glutamyl-Q(34) synthetase GluQRS [Pseudarthrobacter sp. J75]MEE2570385.1 tRNA glutamyl-Q(34) synthetase GluQRS [Pseudarthrobacter sp. J64]